MGILYLMEDSPRFRPPSPLHVCYVRAGPSPHGFASGGAPALLCALNVPKQSSIPTPALCPLHQLLRLIFHHDVPFFVNFLGYS